MTQVMIFDADVSGVSLGNVIEFPEPVPSPLETAPGKPKGNPSVSDYSSTDLATDVGVSRQAWARDWFPSLAKVAGADALRTGRRYTVLCRELNLSLQAARRSGQSSSAWVASAAARRPDQSIEARAEVVAMAAEISVVPTSVHLVAGTQGIALGRATQVQDLAQALLDRLTGTLELHARQTEQTNGEISDAIIVAKITARLIHEAQIEAKVRADFEAKRQAAIAQGLNEDLAKLQGGGN